ncbi:MAG: LysM peptidoglycan-binding domain-containing protein [Gemmatimonadota bacterium]
MRSSATTKAVGIPLLAVSLAACGGSTPPPRVTVEPAPVSTAAAVAETDPAVQREREPDASLEDRWRAPFAISSSGRTVAREPRQVAVIGADPAIAQALVEIRSAAASDVSGSATNPDPAPRGAPGDDSSESRETAAGTSGPPDAGTSGPPDADPRYHLVGRGDTWIGIAREYGLEASMLAAVNPGVDPGRIRVGQRLRLPDGDLQDGRITHRVGSGDTLWGIARRYNVTADRIRDVNDLADDRVRIGQTLIIPVPADDS